MTDEPCLIGLDWGTSSLRGFLFGAGGRVMESRAEAMGIMRLPEGGFPAAFAAVAGPWLRDHPTLPTLAAGMVGSAQGWREVPYHRGSAGPEELGRSLAEVPAGGGAVLRIIPGIAQDGDRPDVMRGEETQIVGALALRPGLGSRSLLVMPGTHCKWVEVKEGRIVSFSTFLTGELFSALCAHTILGRLAHEAGGEAGSEAAFERGVLAARGSANGLAPLLFPVRSLVLRDRLRAAESLDYLSGVLIGDEVRSALPATAREVALIGDAGLCARYRKVLAAFGVAQCAVVSGAAEAGLWRIALAARLVPASGPVPRTRETE